MKEIKTVTVKIRNGFTSDEFISKLNGYGATNIVKVSAKEVKFDIYFLKAPYFTDFDEVEELSFEDSKSSVAADIVTREEIIAKLIPQSIPQVSSKQVIKDKSEN